MFKRNTSQAAEGYEAYARPKLPNGKKIALIIALSALGALFAVIKLNQIFHWWVTPPW